jgi:hypothetical protein
MNVVIPLTHIIRCSDGTGVPAVLHQPIFILII